MKTHQTNTTQKVRKPIGKLSKYLLSTLLLTAGCVNSQTEAPQEVKSADSPSSLITLDAQNRRRIGLIEVASEYGAGTRGSSLGPDAFTIACLTENKPWCHALYPPVSRVDGNKRDLFLPTFEFGKHIDKIVRINQSVREGVTLALRRRLFPLILHGDHSNSIGTFAAIAQQGGKQCLVYMDAHGDLHSPWTTPSGNVHGMPVLAAINARHRNEDRQNQVDPKVNTHWQQLVTMAGNREPMVARDGLVLVGTRSTEGPENNFIRDNRIRVYRVNEVRTNPARVAHTILNLLQSRGCNRFVVSVDIDVLDARLVPGTGTPEPNGLEIAELSTMLEIFWRSRMLAALEISELSPPRDTQNKTSEVAVKLVDALVNLPVNVKKSN